MRKQARRSLWGAGSVVVAVLFLFLIVNALAAKTPLVGPTEQPYHKKNALDKLDGDLTLDQRGASIAMGEEVRVIIRLHTSAEPKGRGFTALGASVYPFEQAKGEVLAALSAGGVGALSEPEVKDLPGIGAIALTVSTRKLNQLAYLDAVEYISEDKPVHALIDESVPLVGAPAVWARNDSAGNNLTGQGITIAIIDTGIDYTHPDLGGCTQAAFYAGNCKLLPGWDYVNNDNESMDDNGHGTHVAGIAAANGTLKGVAPDATLVAYKVLDENGDGRVSDVILAIENATVASYNIISLSLGTDGSADDDLSLAVDAAVDAGVIVVAAAGNSGPSDRSIRSPGNSRKAITVGNTYKNDSIRESSSRGPASGSNNIKPDLTAPGVDINSTKLGGGYELMNGTSMSAPHVSGAAALILQKNPTWSPAMVKGALVGHTKDVGLRAVDQGSGRLAVNQSINTQVIGGSVSLALGTVSSSSTNTTTTFTLRNLLNASINVTLSSTVVTNTNASSSLNQSWVNISALGNTSVELLVNWSAGTEGYVDGRISADNLTIPFMLEIAGYRMIVIETVGGSEVYDVLVREVTSDGLNELIMAYDDSPYGRIRSAGYNSSFNNWTIVTISETDNADAVEIGDIDNDSLKEVASGDFSGVFRIHKYNTSEGSWIQIYNFTTDAQAIEEIKIKDINNDSIPEVLFTTYNNSDNGKIWQFRFINESWNYTVLHKEVYIDRIPVFDVGDVDNDGLPEMVWRNFSATLEYLIVSKYVNDSWEHIQMDTLPGTTANSIAGVIIGDVDEDGGNEIVLGGGNTTYGWVRLYEFQGNMTWGGTDIFNTTGRAFNGAIYDGNNDGKTDIVIGLRNGLGVRLLERQIDNVTWLPTVVAQNLPGNRLVRVVDIGDATNNGLNEITSGYGFGGDSASYLYYFIEDPRISNLQTSISQPTKLDTQTFRARVQDSDGLSTVTLYWRNGTVDWQSANMSWADTQNFTATISAQPWNTTIDYFVKATDTTGTSNQTPIYNYTVLVNRLGNASTLLTNLSNVTVRIAGNSSLNATYYGSALVEIIANGSTLVEFTHPFADELLDLRNVTLNASQDNITGWILVKNLSLPSGTNKTLYLQHLNASAGFVCIKDAEVSSIDNISASCAGTNETLVECNNVSVSGYRCENVSNWWKVTGAAHTAIKEMGNAAPQITATGPSGTVTSSSTTLSATTNEPASCKYSTTQGQAYDAMPSSFTGTGTSHSQALTGLANGAYTYYALCQDPNGANSSESTISFTVSITTSSGGGGGGAAPTPADQNKKETTYASLTADKENTLFVDRSTIAATKVGFVNTVSATNVKLSVSVVNTSILDDPLDVAYGYFNVTLEGLYAHELGGAWIEFKVNTSWITEQNATKEDVRLKRQRSTWEELDTAWMKDSGAYSHFNASTPGFSVFAIALAAREPVIEEPEQPEPEVNITKEPEPQINLSQEPPGAPAEPPKKSIFQSTLFTIAAATLLATTGMGYIYRNRLTIGARIEELLKHLRQRREQRGKRKLSKGQDQLQSFIAKCRERGYDDEEIRKALLEHGWNKDLVERGLK